MKTAASLTVTLLLLFATAGPACAQAYPARPIRIVVGFPPGGGNDLVARMFGAKMQETWGQPVVIENKPGANTIIAGEFVAKSAPDGHTLLVNATGGTTIIPSLYAKLPFDPQRDFIPISMIGIFPMIVAVNASVPALTLQEFIAYARANPGRINYGAGATAFQLATEMFKQMTGTSMNHIPYKGSAQTATALLAGEVQMSIIDTPPTLQHLKSGRLRALAVTTAKRVGSLADVPTVSEAGVPGYEMTIWISVFAPAGTPRDIVARLNAEIVRIVNLPDIREKLIAMGVEPVGNTSGELAEIIRIETAKFAQVIKAANIKAE
ncbi:MAG: tripartite tricarboxylate transporter substrate binding protein [Betaproteobacteria bacterium]|nr:tripartite tricarboxylate transporter substrate binding protein [Betaproteobacteria bacterium]